MKKILLYLVPVLLNACSANGQMTTRVVRDSLFIPWELVYAPDNHIWFTQKNGYICRLNPDTRKIDTLYHETNTVIQNEGGMLGMALHPQFPNTPFVYVAYNYLNGSVYKERIVRYQYNGTILQNALTIMDNINASNIHNGCRLLADGNYLYITTGDASTSSIAQNTNAINGKTLRILLDGTIPADNPIAGNPAWSSGHRNAQGMVMVSGKIIQTEHGDNVEDEVNIVQRGRNYGWPNVKGYCDVPAETGFCTDSNVAEPIKSWTPTLAVAGVDYYDHPMFPSLQKSLIMATLKDQKLYQLKINANLDGIMSTSVISGVNYGRLRDVCISPEGKIYISTSTSNPTGTGTRVDKIIEIYDPSFVGIGTQEKSGRDINIYPNPSQNEITIQVNSNVKHTLSCIIKNMQGQTVKKVHLSQPINTINIQALPPALYVIQVLDANSVMLQQKLVKQ